MLWTFAFPQFGVVTWTTVIMLEKVFEVLLGVIVFGEPLDVFMVVGALMTFSAIFQVANGKPL